MEPLEIFDSINNKQIKIYVTTEIAKKFRTDTVFAQNLFNKLQEQAVDEGSVIEVEKIKTEAPDGSIIEEKCDKETWARRDTLKLLKVYQKYKHKFKDYRQRKVVWTMIAKELSRLDVFKTPEKCAEKWKNLLRTYKTASRKSPSVPTRFQYYQEMKDILSNTQVTVSNSESEHEVDEKFQIQCLPSLEGKEESTEKESWSRYETLKLLQAFHKYKGLKKNFVKEKQFWAVVSAELAKDKIRKPIEKCATKWKNLFRSYKKNVDKPNLPLRFQYFQEMSDVMNDVEIHIPDDVMNFTDDVNFEKILEPEQFKCFLEEVDFENSTKEVVSWTADETIKLIKTYKKHKHKFRKCPTKKYVWAIISSVLASEGSHKDAEKCESKWKSLLRAYKRGVRIGESPRFSFYNEMSEVVNFSELLNDADVSATQSDTALASDNGELDSGEIDNDEVDNGEVDNGELDNGELDNIDSLENTEVVENEGNDDADITYEEIIIETEPEKPDDTDKYWSYNETVALLRAYAVHRKRFKEVKKRAEVWEEISQELECLNVHKSADACEKKWRSMFSVYKTHKLNNTGPGKFMFYKEIDDILREKPEEKPEDDANDEIALRVKKCKCMEKRILEKQARHIERMQLLKRKLDLEERKVEAFEEYVKHLKRNKSLL